MATGWILKTLRPGDLKNHPVNNEVYGVQVINSDLLESVKKFGVIEPIRTTKDLVIISGHRRRQHAEEARLKEVPVLVARHSISDEEQVVELIESNRQREKTREVLAREYARLSDALAELARKRQAHGRTAPGKTLTGKFPEASKGEAKTKAAEQIGMDRKTADKALEVVKVIDAKESEGDKEGAAQLREKLNTGTVAAAHRAAKGEPEKPRKQPEPKKTAPKQDNCLPLNEAIEELNAAVREVRKQWPEDQLAILPAKLRKLADEIEKSIK